MENASKALIIAGAILLSILIIGLGMMIYNQAMSAVEDTGLDAQRISTYNSEFDAYIGDNKRGTDVRSLINIIKSHNSAEDDQDAANNSRIVSFNGVSGAAELDAERNKISTGKRYKVEVTEYKDGLIKTITATPQ